MTDRQRNKRTAPPPVTGRIHPVGPSPDLLLDRHARILFDTISQGVIFRDREDRVVSANPAAERILGRPLAELLGRTSAATHEHALRDDSSPLAAGEFPAEIALRTGQPVTDFIMGTLNPSDGDRHWLSVQAVPIFPPGADAPSLVYVVFENISERRRMLRELRQAREQLEQDVQERTRELADANRELSAQVDVRRQTEEALRESEGKFRRLAENAEDVIYLYRLQPERGFEYVSPSVTRITGYTPEEHYADPELGYRLVHADDRHLLDGIAAGTIDARTPVTLRWVRKDGGIIWIELRNIPITDGEGRNVAIQGTARDISERVRAEERLRENEKFLQTVIDTEPECVKMVARDGSLLTMNRAGLDMIDAESLDQVRGKCIYALIDARFRQDFKALTEGVFEGRSGGLVFKATGLKGRKIWLETSAVPLRDENNAIVAALGITRDITERKKMEVLLRESEASLHEAQRLAHIGSWSRDVRTGEVRWSPETFRILGLDPARDAPSFDALQNAIRPQDRDRVTDALDKALRLNVPFDAEFRILRPDGVVRIVHAQAAVIADEAGAPFRLLGTMQDLTERRSAEELLPRIAQRISERTGEEYLRSVAEFVAQELGTDYAIIAERLADERTMRTVTVFSHGKFVDNFEYDIANTPCENVVGKRSCFYPEKMHKRFPRDALLADLGVESYAGVPLSDTAGTPLGALFTLGCTPMQETSRDQVLLILQIFASRVAAELERRRSETALRESEQRYRQMLESVTSYIYTVNVEKGRAVSTVHGKACAAVTGYTAEEFAASPFLWYEMVHDADKSMVLAQSARVIAGGRPEPIEHRIRHKSGRTVWIRNTVVPRFDAQGGLVSYDGLIEDISERKQAENLVKNILEAVDEGFVVIDRTFSIVSANRAFLAQVGLDLGQVVGRKCYDVTHSLSCPCFERGEPCAVRDAFQGGASATVFQTHTHHAPSGKPIHVETRAFPLRNDSGEVIAAIEITNNVTDRMRLEEQLLQAQKMEAIGLLAGGVAHDFNNILTAIVGYGNLLKMKTASDDPRRNYIDQVLGSAGRAASLTQGLLAFSRKQAINPRPMNINETLRRMEKLLRRIISEDIDLRIETPPEALTIMADPSQIEQAVMNLVTNARDAILSGGSIVLQTSTAVIDDEFRKLYPFGIPGTYALVSVRDTGTGMDADTRKRVFEPFFTTKETGKGTGLGLAIVYGIMKQNKGFVTVESEPGAGSHFRLYFPLVAGPVEPEHVAEPL
ncbi:MAG TPA: PAS domain S-box protein, partial [Candidatus Deferrimicrobiaceae bacterium]